MSNFSITGYNPNNTYDTLYTRQNQNIVVSDSIPQITATNYARVSLETPPDTFELSAESKIKKNKEKGMPTALKYLLGIGGTAVAIYGCIVGHRALNKPSLEKVTKNFSEIFRKDISKEEAQKMANRYKEIFQIKDDTEFQKTLFEQLKKDYGLQGTQYGLSVKQLESGEKGHFTPFGKLELKDSNGGTSFNFDSNGCIAVNSKYAKDRKGFFATLVHELNHAKQFETAYRANSEEALNSYFNKMQKELDFIENLKKKGYDLENELKAPLREFLGTTKPNTLAKGSEEYELGMKYIENQKNYIPAKENGQKYIEQFLEKESFDREHKMADILYYFLPIWRI